MALPAEISSLKIILGEDSLAQDDSTLGALIDDGVIYWNNLSSSGDLGNTTEAVALIKLYLAAHLWAITYEKGGLKLGEVGSVREEYFGGSFRDSQDLNLTRFGRTAASLDISNTLKQRVLTKGKASFNVHKVY